MKIQLLTEALNEAVTFQARASAGLLSEYKIDKLISSPFVRCLQTAKELERELSGCPAAEIALPFCEVCCHFASIIRSGLRILAQKPW